MGRGAQKEGLKASVEKRFAKIIEVRHCVRFISLRFNILYNSADQIIEVSHVIHIVEAGLYDITHTEIITLTIQTRKDPSNLRAPSQPPPWLDKEV